MNNNDILLIIILEHLKRFLVSQKALEESYPITHVLQVNIITQFISTEKILYQLLDVSQM